MSPTITVSVKGMLVLVSVTAEEKGVIRLTFAEVFMYTECFVWFIPASVSSEQISASMLPKGIIRMGISNPLPEKRGFPVKFPTGM